MRELARRSKAQPPPAWAVWEALSDPVYDSTVRREWFSRHAGEVVPTVVEAARPTLVVWSSMWPERSKDLLRFEIHDEDDRLSGCSLTWIWLTPDDEPSDFDLRSRRHRINQLINADLRYSFGQ